MDKITPANYIRLQRKICDPKAIIVANKLAAEWGLTPDQACHRLLCETLVIEFDKRKLENVKQ